MRLVFFSSLIRPSSTSAMASCGQKNKVRLKGGGGMLVRSVTAANAVAAAYNQRPQTAITVSCFQAILLSVFIETSKNMKPSHRYAVETRGGGW